jgi:hypothetical protein
MMLAVSVQALADESAYPTNQCIDRLNDETRLGAIADKVALSSSEETSAAMFELDRPADAAEQTALALWSKLREACFALGAAFRRDMANQEQVALGTRLFELHQGLLGELRQGRVTYGEFNGRRVELYLIASSLEAAILERAEQVTSPEGPALPVGHSEI